MAAMNVFTRAGDAEPVEPGQVIFDEGDPGDTMFAVAEGQVDIVLDGRVIESVTVGGIFGELALVDEVHAVPERSPARRPGWSRSTSAGSCSSSRSTPPSRLQVMGVLAARLRTLNEAPAWP